MYTCAHTEQLNNTGNMIIIIVISLENKTKTGSHRKAHTKQKTHKI